MYNTKLYRVYRNGVPQNIVLRLFDGFSVPLLIKILTDKGFDLEKDDIELYVYDTKIELVDVNR